MTLLDRILQISQQQPKRIVFPETKDDRVIAAAKKLAELGAAIPILISEEEKPRPSLPANVEWISLTDPKLARQTADQLYDNRKHRGLSLEGAELAVSDPLLFASLLIRLGFADGGVAGSLATTANVIRAGLYGIGTLPGKNLVSSFFLMQFADRCWTFADCAVVPEPNAQQLAQIAIDSARNHQRLTGDLPRVAMLSFSTRGSAEHECVTKVRQATAWVKEWAPDLAVDGELQFDAAAVAEVGASKAPGSPVAGSANVFVFPDLDAGNIGYKIAHRLGNCQAIGPIIQGLSLPFMDLSRGCSVDDIVNVALIAGILADDTQKPSL